MKKAIFGIALVLFSGLAVAEEFPQAYWGVSYMKTSIDDDLEFGFDEFSGVLNQSGISSNISTDDSGFKAYAGYDLDPNFGFEVSYQTLGEYKAEGSGGGTTIRTTMDFSSIGFAGLLRAPFALGDHDTMSLFAKLGVHSYTADISLSASDGTVLGGERKDSDIYYGVGVDLLDNDTSNITIRAEYERYVTAIGDIDAVSFSLGFRWK